MESLTTNITKKNDKYYVIVNWYENKKRKQKWVSTGMSVSDTKKSEIEQARIKIHEEWRKKLSLCNYEEILFSDYLKKWLRDTKYTISENTYYTYERVLDGVICPYFEQINVKLNDLKAYHIQDFYTYKMEHDGVSPNTILHYHANIHKALEYAVKTERIEKNPANCVDKPRKTKKVVDYYNAEELKALLQAVKGSKLEPVVLTAVWFGLRRSEILGLKWRSLDFSNKTLTVSGAVVKFRGEVQYKETGKTKSSLRTLPMSDEAIMYFQDLKARQEENRKKRKRNYNTKWDGFVFVDETGDIIKPEYVSRNFPKLCEECNLRRITLHCLRHSNISLLADNGISMKEIQEWAGHSDYSTTANIYSHVLAKNKLKLSDTIQKALQ